VNGLNFLISAGEASGDLLGARLLQALRAREPGVRAFGMGGSRLEAAGLERVARSEEIAVMGFSEVFGRVPQILAAIASLRREAARRRPEAAVLIDFPDFHSILARRLRAEGIPLIYYVSPQVWAWRSGRARAIAGRARRILTLFAFETEVFRRLGADAVWTGHPIVDDVREGLAAGPPTPEKSAPRLVLMPGSRRGEVRRHWPSMRSAATRLAAARGVEAFAVRAPGVPEELYPGAREAGVRIVASGVHPLLASADVAFVASGTATLETALCGTPMVVVYRTSATTFAIGRALVRVPWISLVNIVGQEEVVPELLQDRVTGEELERAGLELLDSADRRDRMKRGLARVAAALGPPGASERAAEAAIDAVKGSAATDRARAAGR
jgi:lipid-A-disaccharide synthase